MICSKCGRNNDAKAKFCLGCGTKLAPAEVQPVQRVQQDLSTRPQQDLSTRPLTLASLILEDGNKEIQLPFLPQVHIGRMDRSNGILPEVDLTDTDKNKVTSRKHAAIIYSDGKYYLKDFGSMNGSFINDKRLESNVEHPLKHEDKIMLGKLIFTFKCNN